MFPGRKTSPIFIARPGDRALQARERIIKALQDTAIPECESELIEITGAPIRYDIDWEDFSNDAAGLNFLDNLSCHRLNMALRAICSDSLGKEAVAEGLKVVKLIFADGALEMRCAYAPGTNGYHNDNEIREVLMKGL